MVEQWQHLSIEGRLGAVDYWQSEEPNVYPLTCGNDFSHTPLYPRVNQDDVELYCLDCEYIQTWVPEHVYQLAYAEGKALPCA